MNETVAVLRDQVENLRAELANMRARREQDMHHVESLLAERDEWRALATKAQDQRDQWMSKAGELTEEVAGLRESIERADAAALSTIREVTKERDEALVKVERADALLGEWYSLDPDDEDPARSLYARTEDYFIRPSDTNPRI